MSSLELKKLLPKGSFGSGVSVHSRQEQSLVDLSAYRGTFAPWPTIKTGFLREAFGRERSGQLQRIALADEVGRSDLFLQPQALRSINSIL
jgi:hypothetical protein